MLDDVTRGELEAIISSDSKLLGQIFRLTQQGVTNAKDLVDQSDAANRGVVYNNLTQLKVLLNSEMPTGATISRHSAYAVGRLLKNNPQMSQKLKDYLVDLRFRSLNNAQSLNAVLHDQALIENQSEKLSQQAAKIQNGIYVYTFPTYLHFGTIEDEDVSWFKIGSTKNSVWQRIVEQNRQTSMPEDPKLLQIYHKDGMNIDEIEKKFHSTLDRVGHERSAARRTKSGTEWFATTLDAIDAMAELMDLQIERYEASEENL